VRLDKSNITQLWKFFPASLLGFVAEKLDIICVSLHIQQHEQREWSAGRRQKKSTWWAGGKRLGENEQIREFEFV